MTFAASVLLAGLYCMIFRLSAQDADASGGLSQSLSMKVMEAVNFLLGGRFDGEALADMAAAVEHPIRKLAHFSEYGYMGVLVYIILAQWMKRGRGLYLATALWVFFSAACDEIHQYFVPGRYASVADVALDTCGGVCGMLLCVFSTALYQSYRRRRAAGRRKSK